MFEKGVPVNIGGEEKFFVCTTAAYEMICEKYGDMESMAEVFRGPQDEETDTEEERALKSKERVKAGNKVFIVGPWLFSILANQGEMLKNRCTKLDAPLTEEYIKLVTAPKEIEELMESAMQAIAIGFGTEHQTDAGKYDPVLEELDRKNAEGAAE